MRRTVDQLFMALGSGLSRRETIGSLLAGVAALRPGTSEGKKRRKRKKKGNPDAERYLEYCQEWCGKRFGVGTSEAQACVNKAKEGRGACYSESEMGPGWFCAALACENACCPRIDSDAVDYGQCCPPGFGCVVENGNLTGFCG